MGFQGDCELDEVLTVCHSVRFERDFVWKIGMDLWMYNLVVLGVE